MGFTDCAVFNTFRFKGFLSFLKLPVKKNEGNKHPFTRGEALAAMHLTSIFAIRFTSFFCGREKNDSTGFLIKERHRWISSSEDAHIGALHL